MSIQFNNTIALSNRLLLSCGILAGIIGIGEAIAANYRPGIQHNRFLADLAEPRPLVNSFPKASDVIFSPRRLARLKQQNTNVLDVAEKFHATKIAWVYFQEDDAYIAELLAEDYPLSVAMGIFDSPHIPTPSAINPVRSPHLYRKGRMLEVDGSDHYIDISNPESLEVRSRYARFLSQFLPVSVHQDEPSQRFQTYSLSVPALERFREFLLMNCTDDQLEEKGLPHDRDALTVEVLASYIRDHSETQSLPVAFDHHWKRFRLGDHAAYFNYTRDRMNEESGKEIPWSANHGSYIQFNADRIWSEIITTEVQPENTRFGIANPWSIHRKTVIARKLKKPFIFTFGSASPDENRKMIALSCSLGINMYCPWDVYMKEGPRFMGDPEDYDDLYRFIRSHSALLDGYGHVFGFGTGVEDERFMGIPDIQPFSMRNLGFPSYSFEGYVPPIFPEVYDNNLFLFVRAKSGDRMAPVVVHLYNWGNAPLENIRLFLQPNMYFGGAPFKVSFLAPGRDSQDLGEGHLYSVTVPELPLWGMLTLTPMPAVAGTPAQPVLFSETPRFFDQTVVMISVPGEASEIFYTLDGTQPGPGNGTRYTRPIELSTNMVIRATATNGDIFGPVASLSVQKMEKTALQLKSTTLQPGVNYEVQEQYVLQTGIDYTDPMFSPEPEIGFKEPVQGVQAGIGIPVEFQDRTEFNLKLTGFIRIPEDGLYRFYSRHSDTVELRINGNVVIADHGRKVIDLHDTELWGEMPLDAGFHPISVELLQIGREPAKLQLFVEFAGLPRKPVPDEWLFRSRSVLSHD